MASPTSPSPAARRTRNPRGRGADLRADLLAAADAVLDDTGEPDRVTVRGLATAVGVAPNAVYLHFADREALLAEVAIARYHACTAELVAATADLTDPLAALVAGHETYCRLALERPGHYRLLFRVLAAEVSPALSQRVAEAGMAFFQTCVDCCRACLDAGVLRGDDPVRLAGAVWALEHGWCEIALAGEVGASLVPPPRDALLLLLDAHRPRPSPPQSADH